MITAADSIEIACPPDEVYGWLANPKRVMDWIPHMIENDHGGAMRPSQGETFKQVYETRTGSVSCNGEFIAVKENELLALSLTRGRTQVECQYTLEPSRLGTLVTQEAIARTKWPLTPIIWIVKPVASWIAQRQLRTNLERLKSTCESTTEAPNQ